MITTLPGRGRISGNPFVKANPRAAAQSGDTLTRILNSDVIGALLRVLLLLLAANVALAATMTIGG